MIAKLSEDLNQLSNKFAELKTIPIQQTSINQRPMTADSKIANDKEKELTKIKANSTPKQQEGDAHLFRSLKSSSNISSEGQNTNASEEVRAKPIVSSIVSSSRIFESLKGKLEHFDQQKVDIYELEMMKGHMVQRMSELEQSITLSIKE